MGDWWWVVDRQPPGEFLSQLKTVVSEELDNHSHYRKETSDHNSTVETELVCLLLGQPASLTGEFRHTELH